MSADAAAPRLLLVEDNASLRRGVAWALGERFGRVDAEGRGDRAVERLRTRGVEAYDVVVTDLRLPGAGGLEVLGAARERDPDTPVILMTAYGTIDGAVDAMRRGALDFLQKPFELEELEARVTRALEVRAEAGRTTPGADAAAAAIVGRSAALRAAVGLARRVARTPSTVLVTGETGTGKELVARLVHAASPRAGGPFVEVNCAALPEPLLESELFGHERGAFTSADRMRIGRFEQAHLGTLFLDEVGDTSPATQAKLLRVLQDQEFHRLGGTEPIRTDVRIVAATNRDLEADVAAGRFRADLFYRLDVVGIALPPLRERPEDVAALAEHFLARAGERAGRELEGFTPEARERLVRHPWPGNVRELRNRIERAALLARGPRVDVADLDLRAGGAAVASGPGGAPSPSGAAPGPWSPRLPAEGLALDEIERAVVLEALERCDFVQKDAAALIGVSRRKLNYMVRRLGITHPRWRRNRTGRGTDDAGPGERGGAARIR